MNGAKIQYLNREDALEAVVQILDALNSEDWKVVIQKVGVDYRVQYVQVRKK